MEHLGASARERFQPLRQNPGNSGNFRLPCFSPFIMPHICLSVEMTMEKRKSDCYSE